MAPAGDPGGILEREIEPAQVDDQPQVLDVGSAVLAVRVVAPTGARPRGNRALVEPDGVRRDPTSSASRKSSCATDGCGRGEPSTRAFGLPSVSGLASLRLCRHQRLEQSQRTAEPHRARVDDRVLSVEIGARSG
jgi:hypothetical protein